MQSKRGFAGAGFAGGPRSSPRVVAVVPGCPLLLALVLALTAAWAKVRVAVVPAEAVVVIFASWGSGVLGLVAAVLVAVVAPGVVVVAVAVLVAEVVDVLVVVVVAVVVGVVVVVEVEAVVADDVVTQARPACRQHQTFLDGDHPSCQCEYPMSQL